MKTFFFLLMVFTGLASTGLHAQEALPTLTDTLGADGTTSTLYAALDTADLLTPLDEGPDVIFLAPTNEAFAALPEGVATKLLEPENLAVLREVLSYHIVPAGEESSDMITGKLSGAEASIGNRIECSNGMIYLVDKILLPPGFDVDKLK